MKLFKTNINSEVNYRGLSLKNQLFGFTLIKNFKLKDHIIAFSIEIKKILPLYYSIIRKRCSQDYKVVLSKN